MYAMYVFISVILLLIGTVSSVYFIRFFKNVNTQNITVPAFSESLNTLFIGVFYLYCAVIISQRVINHPPTTIDNESDIAIIQENNDKIMEYEEEITTEASEDVGDPTTVTFLPTSGYPNQEFLLNYHAFLQNAIRKTALQKQKESEKSEARETETHEGNGTSSQAEDKCPDDIFMENSMFLYSFLHSVVSLIISAVKTSETNGSASKSQKTVKDEGSNEEGATSPKTQPCNSKQTVTCDKMKLVAKIFVIFLTPVLTIVAFYFVMDQDTQGNLNTKLFDPSKIDSNIWTIIQKPINVSIPEKKHEINDIVNNIYTIVNASRDSTPNFEIYDVSTRRRPKQLETCPNYNKMYRVYILLVLLLYFTAIFYAKIREMRLRNSDKKAAQQLNISIISFAVLWIFSIFEMISKAYFLDSSASSILTEVFLSLGNLDQLSIIVMNYLTTKETMKKYNLVEPQA